MAVLDQPPFEPVTAVEVVGAVTQKLDHPHPSTYVGKGKLQEIKELQEPGTVLECPRHGQKEAKTRWFYGRSWIAAHISRF